ncbi:MAG: TIGR02147 family protein [Chitinivibrionales bacterium]|nr:TIGR02147 family protein [Chitinivibrionales bacterium]
MISVYDYNDYRHFLKDFYSAYKKDKPIFSYRYIAGKVEMNFSYVIKVLNGSLHITADKIAKFAQLCKLPAQEAEYFENLVYFTKSKSATEKKLFSEKLYALKKMKLKQIEFSQRKIYSKWYYVPIWNLLTYCPFDGDYAALAAKLIPQISPRQARQAITLLLKLGFIYKDDQGRIVANINYLTTGGKGNPIISNRYLKSMARLMIKGIDHFHLNERSHYSLIFNMSEQDFQKFDCLLKDFQGLLFKNVQEIRETPDNRVYHISIDLLPLSQKGNASLMPPVAD